jgi:putative phosphoesterase
MAVAALYDIHGNLPALEAVLEEIQSSGAEMIIAGGDVITGPMSREALELLTAFKIPVHFILGNCEVFVLAEMNGEEPAKLPEQVIESVKWTAKELNSGHRKLISSWPKTLEMEIAGVGKVLFCHATPRDENEIFTRLTPENKLLPVFENIDADLVVCGHTHMQFDRMVGKTRVVNAGSVGRPYGGTGAFWLMLGPTVELRQTAYDLVKAGEQILKTSYPQAEEFAGIVQNPPSEDEILELFSQAELK